MDSHASHIHIDEIGRRPAVTCFAEVPMAQVARQIDENEVHAVVVVDPDNRPIGLVTRGDILRRGVATGLPPSTPVAEVMTRGVASIRADGDARDAARQMAARECRHMPIVNADGQVVGLLSFDDIFALVEGFLDDLALVIRHERHPSLLRQS